MQILPLLANNCSILSIDNCLSFNSYWPTNHYLDSFTLLTEIKPYIPISGCVIEHILTTTNLTNLEKLYYLLADSLSIINKNQGGKR